MCFALFALILKLKFGKADMLVCESCELLYVSPESSELLYVSPGQCILTAKVFTHKFQSDLVHQN